VVSLDSTVASAIAAGGEIVIAPEDVPWGRRAVVADPDGRPIELNEASSG
jgi:predicted enzyme related to lactoylglutathione lyase